MERKVVLVKVRGANVFVERKHLPTFKDMFQGTFVIAEMTPSSDALNAFIGVPAFIIQVERGLAFTAGRTLSIGKEFSWHDSSGKRIYAFEDGVLVGKRD